MSQTWDNHKRKLQRLEGGFNVRFLSERLIIFQVKQVRWAIVIVATPLWPSVGVKPNTWKSWRFGILRDSPMFRARQQGPNHLALGCSWCHWKLLET